MPPMGLELSVSHSLQFDALRKQLKMKAGDVTMRFRELGATATPAKATEDSSTGQERRYHVVLLPKVCFRPWLLAFAFDL